MKLLLNRLLIRLEERLKIRVKPTKRIENAEFTNMCMVYDGNGNVLVQNRVIGWCGLAFPGDHLEPYESIVDLVIREIKEETGLTIKNPIKILILFTSKLFNNDYFLLASFFKSNFRLCL